METPVSQSALGVPFHLYPPPSNAQEVRQRHEANRRAWNEGAARYTARFEERLALPGVSAFTWAPMNSTTDNQGARCFLVVGLAALANRTGNRSLLSVFNGDFCKTLSAAVAAQLKGSGFDA